MSEDVIHDVPDWMVNRDIERGTSFLRALSTDSDIMRIMKGAGYTEEEHQNGWNLLLILMGYRKVPPTKKSEMMVVQEQAIAELDVWDGPHFSRTRACLDRLHPAQSEFIFNDLRAETGVKAVGSVNTYVERVQVLRDGTDPTREDSREADRAAVATLEKRRIFNSEIEAYLLKLIADATQMAPEPVEKPVDPEQQNHMKTAATFHAWLTDWRETARAVVTRRDYQIRMGLAKRRTKKTNNHQQTVIEVEE